MPKRGDRSFFQLECTSCHRINYATNKNPKNTTDRLELKKYCKFEKKYTIHKETR